MTVGAKNGTASYTWLSEHADQYGYSLRAFDEASTMYDSLNSGSIDALMDDEAVLRYAIKQGRKFETPIDGEKSGEYGFAVNKGANPELLEMFNNGLAALVKQLVVGDHRDADGLCAGAAVPHLADVQVRAVGKVVLLFHVNRPFRRKSPSTTLSRP